MLPNPALGLLPDECHRRVEAGFKALEVTLGVRSKVKGGGGGAGSGTGGGTGDGVGPGSGTGSGTGDGNGDIKAEAKKRLRDPDDLGVIV